MTINIKQNVGTSDGIIFGNICELELQMILKIFQCN